MLSSCSSSPPPPPAAPSSKMKGIRRFRAVEVSVAVATPRVLLCPSACTSEHPSSDAVLQGTVTLKVNRPSTLLDIVVSLQGVSALVARPRSTESDVQRVIDKEVKLDLGGELFELGSYEFAFEFIIPADSTPFQASRYAQVRHAVRAAVRRDKALKCTVWSDAVPVFLIASSQPIDDVPEPTTVVIQDVRHDIGLISLSINSSLLSVGGLASAEFHIPSPPPGIEVFTVNLYLEQTVRLTYSDGARLVSQPRRLEIYRSDSPSRHKKSRTFSTSSTTSSTGGFRELPESPRARASSELASVVSRGRALSNVSENAIDDSEEEPAEDWRHSVLVRLPTSSAGCHPTTPKGTVSRSRVTHRIAGDVTYVLAGATRAVTLQLSKDVVVASCWLGGEGMLLPPYAAREQRSREEEKGCLCQRTFDGLVAQAPAPEQRQPETPPLVFVGSGKHLGRAPAEGSVFVEQL